MASLPFPVVRRCVSFARSLLIASVLAITSPVLAEDGPGVAAVRRANDSVAILLEKKPEPGSDAEKRVAKEISTQLASFLDINELGQRALANHWKTLNAAQRKEYLTLLRELVEGNYIKAMRSNVRYEVRYLKEEEKDGARWVFTELQLERNGRPETMSVDYALRKEGESWRAFDLVTDGVGMVENYRAQFNKIIAKEGVGGLLERMRKKKAQNGS
jgi:phospholipid transport system substrate-binding protein